ncbi:unnamed protein product [Pleuronectes platessa]|uniref:Uncharacterized protein n=1 Tax=Pleuronectes platessa TaxID=8262 RepID=A0A9N7Y4S2_PLEPL|nr:unnamed protein product [Pleuronectes platessa]
MQHLYGGDRWDNALSKSNGLNQSIVGPMQELEKGRGGERRGGGDYTTHSPSLANPPSAYAEQEGGSWEFPQKQKADTERWTFPTVEDEDRCPVKAWSDGAQQSLAGRGETQAPFRRMPRANYPPRQTRCRWSLFRKSGGGHKAQRSLSLCPSLVEWQHRQIGVMVDVFPQSVPGGQSDEIIMRGG